MSRDIEASEYWREQAKLLRGYKSQKEPETAVQEPQSGSESLSPAGNDKESRLLREEDLLAPLEEGAAVFMSSELSPNKIYTFYPVLPAEGEPYQAKALSFISAWDYGYIWIFELESGERVKKRILKETDD